MIVGKSLTFSFIMIIRRLLLFARLSYYFSPVHTIYQAHRLLTSGLKAHKVVHASLGSRFGQQDLYLPILIEILMIYFFQYGSFGGSVGRGQMNWSVSTHFCTKHIYQNLVFVSCTHRDLYLIYAPLVNQGCKVFMLHRSQRKNREEKFFVR